MVTTEYDVIVIGAGSSGATLAARLVQRGHRVLLLESGIDWRSELCLPELRSPRNSFAWTVDSVPSTYQWPDLQASRVFEHAQELYIRGRGLGGTSSINGMIAIRPPMSEFDDWVDEGCVGWGPADVIPRFSRFENDIDYGAADYHGTAGPIPITRLPEDAWGTVDQLMRAGAEGLGHAWEPDHNTPSGLGVSRVASNIRLGVRMSSNDAFLEPLRNDDRLTIVCDALVDRVLFDDAGSAIGVQAVVGGEVEKFYAGETVVSAGAAMTPAILQRSGIGPADVLAGAGVPVRVDLPVGRGAQDHTGFAFVTRFSAAKPAQHAFGGRGNVSIRYTSGTDGYGEGDLLITATNVLSEENPESRMLVKLAQCHSAGYVAITSPDPAAMPRMHLGMLSDDRDVQLTRRAFRDVMQLTETSEFQSLLERITDNNGVEISSAWTDAEIDEWATRNASATGHISSSVRMGHPDGALTAVDTEARVLGVNALRVADMSITPTVPRANTNLTAFMIGERVADFISPVDVD